MMRALRLMLLLLFMLIAGGVAAVDAGLQPVDTDPLPFQELDLDGAITVYFDRELDCETVAAAASINPALAGTFACADDAQAVIFTPDATYQPGKNYTVTFSTDLRAADGTALADPASFDFVTLGSLEVIEVLPGVESTGIATEAVLTVIFNRPVVPLGVPSDELDLPQPLTISPETAGQGEWLNTSIYTFRPSPSWVAGQTYTVTVGDDFQAVDGAQMNEAFIWTFTIEVPRLVDTNPADGATSVRLEPRLQARFNVPLDRASLEAAFTVIPDGATESVPGAFQWNERSTGFSFVPSERLQLDTIYDIGFAADSVFDITGQAALPETRWSIATVPFPAVVRTEPFDGRTSVDPSMRVTIYFASPMDRETIIPRVVIDPEPWREPEFFYQTWNDAIMVSFPTEPSTDYTVTLEAGAADIYGNTIDTDFTFSYSTAPFSPDVELRVPGPVGFYDATREMTSLFVTHRNVSRLDLQLYSVGLDEFIARYEDSWNPLHDFLPQPDNLLRAWEIESIAPENARRYELLDLVGGGGSVVCPGAPESRVKVGDSVVVVTTPDPVRARSAPLDGEIIDLLYRDYAMPIVGGPVCQGNLLWWEVQLRGGQLAWIAEGTNDEYFIDVRIPGQVTEVQIPQAFADGDALAPGVYYLTVSAPELDDRYFRHLHFLVVADTNLTVKLGMDNVFVWATDVASGQPVAGVSIDLFNTRNERVGQVTTDADGVGQVSIPRLGDLETQPIAAVLRDGGRFGLSISTWSDGIEPFWFNTPFMSHPQNYSVYIYTDRPVYRPDQPVYFRGVVRLKDDMSYLPADLETVPVTITDDQGSVIYERDLPLTEFGTFSDEFMLAADAPLGFYRLSMELPTERRWHFEGGSVFFNVAQYRLPEFQIELTPQATEVLQGETIRVDLEGRYFFGGALRDANVEYAVITDPHFFNYTGRDGYYDFADMGSDSGMDGPGYGAVIASGSGVTDAQGRLTIEVPADLGGAQFSQRFMIEAIVTDESQQVVAARVYVVVHQGEFYIGARPAEYVGTAGRDTALQFIAVDWDSRPIAGQDIDVEIVERRWSSVQEEDPGGRTVWVWEVEEIPVTTASVTTGDDGRASYTFIPPAGGIYKVIATSRDAAGNDVRSATILWVSGREYVTWRQDNNNRIELITDATSYDIGDTAQVLITSPFQGSVEALITIERAGVLQYERITLDSNSYVYEVPIEADFAPTAFISVILVKGVDDTSPVAGFRMGLAQLNVDNSRRQLTLEVTADVEQAGPGDTVSYTVRATDHEGNPVQAELGVALTDLASLLLAEPNAGPILDHFYGTQYLTVRTAMPLTISTDLLTQTVLDTIKGGGGGGGFDGGIFDIRQEFLDTALWEGALVTDADGEATFSVTLPDNLTTWRLDVRALTAAADMLVGQETTDIISTRPLLIRPVTPRFFVVDDALTLAAVINNNTGSAQSVEVAIEGTGVIFQGETVQTAVIPAGGRQRIDWPVIVSDVDAVDLTFYVISEDGNFADASKPPLGRGDERLLPVYRYEAPDIAGTGGVLRSADSVTESIVLPRRFEVTQGELTVNLEPSLAAASIEALRVLERYPYESIEATISRFLPNVMTYRALKKLDVPGNEALLAALDTQVQLAIQRLYAQQKTDGGWGWFVQDNSSPLVTAYALIGLTAARDNGFVVEATVIDRAQRFLEGSFRAITPAMPSWQIDRQVFVLHALAYAGVPDVARMQQHYDSRERLSIYAKALLATGLDLAAEGDSRAQTLLSDIVNDAITSANGIHWEEARRDFWNWNTNTRTTSMVLQTLIRMRPDSELIPNVVRWLMVARSADAWETTQETAWAVMALADWMLISGDLNPVYEFGLTFNNEILAQAQASPATATETQQLLIDVEQMLRDETNRLTVTRGAGEGNLYYTAYLRLFLPVAEIEPISSGVTIDRRYTLLNDPTRDPITEARIGDVVQVRLTIIAPNNLHYVVVEDPLPAGAEGIDPNLDISQQIGTRPGLDTRDPLSRGWGWWWFSNIEFRDEKVVLHSSYLPAGTYEYVYTIRPGIEGTFNVLPPTIRETYFPDVFGRGAGSIFTILPAEE